MQTILQATHGVVSGAPEFFKRAFGDTAEDFERILLHPHDYIFNRDWYERHDQSQELHEYREAAEKLTADERGELLALLSSCEPREFNSLSANASSERVKHVLPFYVPKPKSELFDIWARQKAITQSGSEEGELTDEERVEDAGLDQEIVISSQSPHKESNRRARAVA